MNPLPPCLIFDVAKRASVERLRGSTDVKWVIRCFNREAHKHDDKRPSAFLDGMRNCFGCSACGRTLSAKSFAEEVGVDWLAVLDAYGAPSTSEQREVHSAPALSIHEAWSALPKADDETLDYLRRRGLDGAADLCRSVPPTAPDLLGVYAGKGLRLALALRDAAGRVVAIQVRATERKDFRTIGSTREGVFGFPEWLGDAVTVVVCEGLTDTLAAVVTTRAEPSVCVVGIAGASSVSALDGIPLDGKRVVIATDADDAGDRAALNIAAALGARGASCFRARPTVGKDLCDMIAAGIDVAALLRGTPIVQASPVTQPFAEPVRTFLGDDEDAADAPEPYVIEGLLPAGVPAALAGEPKSLKTYVGVDMGVCVAAGIPWCGRQTKQGRVVMYLEEDGRAEVSRRLWWLARGHELDPRDLPLAVTAMAGIRLDEPGHVARIIEECRGAALVVIDALSRVHGVDENDRTAMRTVTLALSRIVAETGATVLVVHHYRKAGARDAYGQTRPGQRMRGSGDLHALMRAVIGVKKLITSAAGYSEIELTPESNYGEPAEPFALRFAVEQRTDEKRVARFSATTHLSEDENAALQAIRAGTTSVIKIQQARGGKSERWREVVRGLVRRGLVIQRPGQPLQLAGETA